MTNNKNNKVKVIASFDYSRGEIMAKGTIQGYRGYTIWSKRNKKGLWFIFYRARFSTANFRLIQPFEDEEFGLQVARVVIDSKIGNVGPSAA